MDVLWVGELCEFESAAVGGILGEGLRQNRSRRRGRLRGVFVYEIFACVFDATAVVEVFELDDVFGRELDGEVGIHLDGFFGVADLEAFFECMEFSAGWENLSDGFLEFATIAVALAGVFFEAAHNDIAEGGGQTLVEFDGVGRDFVHVLVEDGLQTAAKGDVSDSELVHHHAHGVDIDAVIDFFAVFDLFGGGVLEGAEDGTCGGFFVDVIEKFSDAKVTEFWGVGIGSVGGEHDVAGLEIAVDDAFTVSVSEGVKKRKEEDAEFFGGEEVFSLDQILFEVGSFDPFLDHTEEVAIVKEFDNSNDGVVLHPKLDLGFANKAPSNDAVNGEVREEKFEGHRAF